MSEAKLDAYQMVTDRMLALMEKGLAPWSRPWLTATSCAWSRESGKPYSLVNQMLLADPDKEYLTMDALLADVSGEWVTFQQALNAGGCVRKGEKGRKIVLFKPWERKTGKKNDDGSDETETVPVLRCYTVFRVSQCDGLEQKHHAEEVACQWPDNMDAETVAASYLKRSGVTYNQVKGSRAYYAPSLDLVVTPCKEQFASPSAYYATLFHELVHSTGHETRLHRINERCAFGDGVYSAEELVAEIGSASIMATMGLASQDSERRSAAYLQNWMEAMKADKKLFVMAAGRAEKALRMILNISQNNE